MENKMRHDGNTECESSWRWVVLAASFLTLLLNSSMSYHVGVLNVAVSERGDAGVETVAWLMAIYVSLFALAAPLGSFVINVSSCRTCIILSGLLAFVGLLASSFVNNTLWFFLTLTIAGLGQSLAQVAANVALVMYFPRKTALASGIANSGGGMGSFAQPALFQLLYEEYSLDGTFLILSAICLHCCILGMLVRPTELEKKTHGNKLKERSSNNSRGSYRTILTNINFLLVLLAAFLSGVAFQVLIVFLPEYLINSQGFLPMEAATIVSCIGIGTVASRPLVGFAATDANIGDTLMFIGLNVVSGLICAIAEAVTSVPPFGAYIVTLAIGVYASTTAILYFPLTVTTLGPKDGASGYGIILMVYGLGSLAGPPFCAVLLQRLGYSVLFKIAGIIFLGAAAVACGIRPRASKQDGEQNDKEFNLRTIGSTDFEMQVPEVPELRHSADANNTPSEAVALIPSPTHTAFSATTHETIGNDTSDSIESTNDAKSSVLIKKTTHPII